MYGLVVGICIGPSAGAGMQTMSEAEALAGLGLKGDRYASGEGSFNKGSPGRRQITLMNAIFFEGSGFEFDDSRRNLFVQGVELMWLIGREFTVGGAKLRGVKYCDPCYRPSKLTGNPRSFQEVFFDRGGLVAEVLEGGTIKINDMVIPPSKGY